MTDDVISRILDSQKILFSYEQLKQPEKNVIFEKYFSLMAKLHCGKSAAFNAIYGNINSLSGADSYTHCIPLPVGMFKELDLASIPIDEAFRVMTSSGTSGDSLSKIYLDKPTALLQSKILARLVSSVLGTKRVPMLVIDCPSTIKDRSKFSARTAGVIGFSNFSKQRFFAFDDDYNLDLDQIEEYLLATQEKNGFVFGFTFLVWECFYNKLRKSSLSFGNSNLLHGGGWKKLLNTTVTKSQFRETLVKTFNFKSVTDYYGMVEQTGSIYLECPQGFLHTNNFNDIFSRDTKSLSVLPCGLEGLLQVISVAPMSYPGYSILTEDMGIIKGIDDCRCGLPGKYFEITRRMPKSELRGCSDAVGV